MARPGRSIAGPTGVYAAVVTRLAGAAVYVRAERLSPGSELRAEILEFPGLPGLATTTADGHAHGVTTPAGGIAEGDRVYVALVEGRPNAVVVLGRVWTGGA